MTSAEAELPRRAERVLERARAHSRVVVLNGPRQSGKTTLMRSVHAKVGGTFVTLDDAEHLVAARRDPRSFVEDFPRPLFVDEVQRGGDPLVLAIKAAVDRDPTPGRFVLAGSSRFLAVPTLTESLAGRARIIDLWPMSQGELAGLPAEDLLDRLLLGEAPAVPVPAPGRRECVPRIAAGGLPGFAFHDEGPRTEAMLDYVRALIHRDVRDLSRVRRPDDLRRLVRLLAARSAQELAVGSLAGDAGLERHTLVAYLGLLETVFLVHRVPAWSRNLTTKMKRAPKVHLVDTGLAVALLGASEARLARPTEPLFGPLLESFVVGELARATTWAREPLTLHHLRDRDGMEVDAILEARDGRVLAFEVKASTTVRDDDTRALRKLAARIGPDFVAGIVLCAGERVVPLGERLWAAPVSALWS